jgi:hypothetical protein
MLQLLRQAPFAFWLPAWLDLVVGLMSGQPEFLKPLT